MRRCLTTIRSLLEDAENLKSIYGLQPIVATVKPVGHHSISSNALKNLRVRLGRSSNGLGILQKTKWAIHDAPKFEKLVGNLRDLVNGLLRETPGTKDLHDEKVQRDITSVTSQVFV